MGRKMVLTYHDVDWKPPAPHGAYRGGIRQLEEGDETARLHWQTYAEFTGPASTKQAAESLGIPWVKKGEHREHSLHIAVAHGTREENAVYCGSSLYCRTHSKGDFKMVFEDGVGKMVPDESFCECADVKAKRQ